MNILAVDTSFSALTVALKTNTGFHTNTIKDIYSQHSERIMPEILTICSQAGLTVNDIDLFACTRGPGSFTGLRIGMAALKGLAFGTGKPLVSVSTLEVFAGTCIGQTSGTVVTVLDAKKQRWYLACFDLSSSEPVRLMADTDGTEEDLDAVLRDRSTVFVTGPDCAVFSEILAKRYPDKVVCADTWADKSVAQALVEIAEEQYKIKGADDIGQGPAYLRKSDAELALEEKNKAQR